ncbi:MAG TPA: HEAT repeat domain-containing protein [Gemmataceae bacterium]|nr:HEAT repeat domain-containing protein [Gemmataceae bacterium]
MQIAILVMAVLLPILMGAAFLFGRYLYRRPNGSLELSAVTRQHIDLFQGGQLSETAVEAAKEQFRELLERGELDALEASLRPGTHYVIQVRALAEIGTDDAGRILERQLQRRLTSDSLEQSWYWIDLANGLRNLHREQSLPQLLRCAEAGGDHPLSHFFAAETVCFLSFAGYLRQPETRLGQAALRVLHRALEGLRSGVQPQIVNEARLGEMIEDLWDHRPAHAHPLIARILFEALRMLRRAPHAELVLAEEKYEQEAFGWQMSHLAALEPALEDYLEKAPRQFCAALATATPDEQRDMLWALADLHAEAAPAVLPLLAEPEFTHAELAAHALTWSRDARTLPWMLDWIAQHVPVVKRAHRRRLHLSPRRPSLPEGSMYAAILRALRGHASEPTEALLLAAGRDWDPAYRGAALGSLCWWEPFDRDRVAECLQEGRRDPNAEIRHTARAALARLGECQALQWFRQALAAQDAQRVHEAIQTVAAEGIYLLWPDLDRLADTENLEVATHACESLERLREDLSPRPV